MSKIGLADDGVDCAGRHALGWLVFGNTVGLWLSLLLIAPGWQSGALTYGRWVPLHLNSQLYGWTALPLVGWLLRIYGVNESKARAWGTAVVWAWTAALAMACYRWLDGETSGKIFLDWRNGSLWAFLAALVMLWLVLAVSWFGQSRVWNRARWFSTAGLIGLACVPVMMIAAASPDTYPPVDRTTGGPTGSSLLGSTLVVVGLMLLLPRATALPGAGRAGRWTWHYFAVSWLAFGITESIGGGHFDSWQIGAMLMLLPWAWLIPRDWKGFKWPDGSKAWRVAMLGWWTLLVLSGVAMYSPGILDRIKFTNSLVAHSHLAMAGFTTSFSALLLSILMRRRIGSAASVAIWHLGAFTMIVVLVILGWREGAGPEWMIVPAGWRHAGLAARAVCGMAMLAASITWLKKPIRS